MGCDRNPEYLLCIGCIGITLPHVHVASFTLHVSTIDEESTHPEHLEMY